MFKLFLLFPLLFLFPAYTFEIRKEPIEMTASWYGVESCVREDCLMANGEKFDENRISCASRQFYGKTIWIRYGDKEILCPVKDKIAKRFDETRVDISKMGFKELSGNLELGLIKVKIY